MTSREDYIKKLQVQLDEWNSEIDILKEDALRAKANTKEAYEKRIEQLRKKCEAAKEKINHIQESNNIGWKVLKEGIEESWNDIKQLFKDTKTEFCKGLEEGKKS
jgi:hypothetical protein